jgi:phosphatidylethanolamine/phosphatidyl-N-methylethanolamine N-methyltransferase
MIRDYWLGFWKWLWYALPSSHFLAKKIVSVAQFWDERTIVELGGWGGVVTSEIIPHLSEGAMLHVFENDDSQVEVLKNRFKKYPQVIIHSESAAHIDKYFSPGSVDIIISTLPLGSISPEWVQHILKASANVLKDSGQYVQYQFWMANRWDVKSFFHIEKTHLELRNYGPAFIYAARKLGK